MSPEMSEKLERYSQPVVRVRRGSVPLMPDKTGDWTPYDAAQAQIQALEQRTEEVEGERDLAIAHDRQPYPTAQAYEKVCAARNNWQDRAEKAENERDEAVEAADRLLGEREAAVTTAERLVGDVRDEVERLRENAVLAAEMALISGEAGGRSQQAVANPIVAECSSVADVLEQIIGKHAEVERKRQEDGP